MRAPGFNAKLDEIKRTITTACAILRLLGAPIGKTDSMDFLVPFVKQEPTGG